MAVAATVLEIARRRASPPPVSQEQARAEANEVVLTDIYAASEDPIPGVTIEALAAAVNKVRPTAVHVVPKLGDVAARVVELAKSGDLVITLGAGSIGGLATNLVSELERRYHAKEAR